MQEIRLHVHIYLLLAASILLAAGGLLSVWRMASIERQYESWSVNQARIISDLRDNSSQNVQILDRLERISKVIVGCKPKP